MNGLIDTHVHWWDPATHDYPWLSNEPVLRTGFGPAEFAPGVPIDGVIVVEAGIRPDLARNELTWLEHQSDATPRLCGIVAQAALETGAAAKSWLAELSDHALVRGVRRNAQDESPGFLISPDFTVGVASLTGLGLTFDACVREHQLAELATLADRCPGVTIILDHLGKPDVRQRRHQPWYDDLAELARRDNVYVKLSGLTTEADRRSWRPADVLPYLQHALAVFGPDRSMFGSDWPVATLATDYATWVSVVETSLSGYAAPARTAVLASTATRVYRISA